MEYNSEVEKLTEIEKKQNLTIMFLIWFKAFHYAGVNRSTAVHALADFMVSEMNWDKKKAMQRILDYFKNQRDITPDELIEIWESLE